MTAEDPDDRTVYRAVARLIDNPVGLGIEWLPGESYDTLPDEQVENDNVLFYVRD